MIHIKYERGIDSVGDVLKTDKKVLFVRNSPAAKLLTLDPREERRELYKRVEFYNKTGTSTPEWVAKG